MDKAYGMYEVGATFLQWLPVLVYRIRHWSLPTLVILLLRRKSSTGAVLDHFLIFLISCFWSRQSWFTGGAQICEYRWSILLVKQLSSSLQILYPTYHQIEFRPGEEDMGFSWRSEQDEHEQIPCCYILVIKIWFTGYGMMSIDPKLAILHFVQIEYFPLRFNACLFTNLRTIINGGNLVILWLHDDTLCCQQCWDNDASARSLLVS